MENKIGIENDVNETTKIRTCLNNIGSELLDMESIMSLISVACSNNNADYFALCQNIRSVAQMLIARLDNCYDNVDTILNDYSIFKEG